MLEFLILTALGGWLFLALRACCRKSRCRGDCGACRGCDRQ